MSNGDESMSPAEFAKLMGAYPEPANNPLPAYGGYMDNSPANFAWVNNNDYFGADDYTDEQLLKVARMDINKHIDNGTFYVLGEEPQAFHDGELDGENFYTIVSLYSQHHEDEDKAETILTNMFKKEYPQYLGDEYYAESFGAEEVEIAYDEYLDGLGGDALILYKDNPSHLFEKAYPIDYEVHMNDYESSLLADIQSGYTENSKMFDEDENLTPYGESVLKEMYDSLIDDALGIDWLASIHPPSEILKRGDPTAYRDGLSEYQDDVEMSSFEAFQDNPEFKEQNHYGADGKNCGCGQDPCITYGADTDLTPTNHMNNSIGQVVPITNPMELPTNLIDTQAGGGPEGQITPNVFSAETRVIIEHDGDFDIYKGFSIYDENDNEGVIVSMGAEMNELTESDVDVSNRFGDTVGIISVEDKDGIEDIEDVDVMISNEYGDVVDVVTLTDDYIPDDKDDYLESETLETVKNSPIAVIGGGLLGAAIIFKPEWFQPITSMISGAYKSVFKSDTQEMLENDPELVENPDTGDLDPAQYEELVVESTGLAVDVIPMSLDPSFMGSRFAALPTDRFVEYNDPGIGAHTDIAMNRDEIYLEPEMAMVQAAEEGNEVKEAQAPGQSPYMSVDGQEPKDFNYRVLHETQVVSLDPAVKPFIPQSMTGYTGNSNTPPSVMNKMFNIGVLGQTPLFVAGQDDMGSSHTGSRRATPDSLGIAGSVGGPLSEKVNANYTDGTTSMSLAQWAIENTVSQSSDTEAVVIDRSSGAMKRVRRV